MKSQTTNTHTTAMDVQPETTNHTTVYGRRMTMTTTRPKDHLQTLTALFLRFVLTLAALAACQSPAMASSQNYHDWSTKPESRS